MALSHMHYRITVDASNLCSVGFIHKLAASSNSSLIDKVDFLLYNAI